MLKVLKEMMGDQQASQTFTTTNIQSKSRINNLLEHAQNSRRNDGEPTGRQTLHNNKLTIEISYQQSVRTCSKLSQKIWGTNRHPKPPQQQTYHRNQLSAIC